MPRGHGSSVPGAGVMQRLRALVHDFPSVRTHGTTINAEGGHKGQPSASLLEAHALVSSDVVVVYTS